MGMKLGTETGSVMNHLYSRMTKGAPAPEVGMGVTILHWTDRTAGTIVEVFKIGEDLAIAITGDDHKVVSGSVMDGSADYEYTSRPDGARSYWRLTEKGWRSVYKNAETGRWKRYDSSNGLIIGKRDYYYDPCF